MFFFLRFLGFFELLVIFLKPYSKAFYFWFIFCLLNKQIQETQSEGQMKTVSFKTFLCRRVKKTRRPFSVSGCFGKSFEE